MVAVSLGVGRFSGKEGGEASAPGLLGGSRKIVTRKRLAADVELARTLRLTMPLPPLIAKGLRVALIVFGALAIASAIVNIIAAGELLEPGDEEALGLSRHWLLAQYALQIVVGAAMIFFGFRRRKP